MVHLELRVVDRGQVSESGGIPLRDVYLRHGNETLLLRTCVPLGTVEKLAGLLTDAALRFEKYAGDPKPKEPTDASKTPDREPNLLVTDGRNQNY